MIIARQLQESNRAEFLLYMWQIEDLLRLYGCDIDRVEAEYLSRFHVTPELQGEMRQWYADLCDMMRAEQKMQHGHLQICENVVIGLADLNQALLDSEKFPYYKQMYYKVLPYVVELRAKRREANPATDAAYGSKGKDGELNLLFEFLYGIMLLRLQKKEVSEDTMRAASDITAFLGQLSDYWKADKRGELKLD